MLTCVAAALALAGCAGPSAPPPPGLRGRGPRVMDGTRVVEPMFDRFRTRRADAPLLLAAQVRNITRDTLLLATTCTSLDVRIERRAGSAAAGAAAWVPAPQGDQPACAMVEPFLLAPGRDEHVGVPLDSTGPDSYRLVLHAERWCSRGPDRAHDRVPCAGGNELPRETLISRPFRLD